MSANGKTASQNMDDILASIRRIIAEEPKGAAANVAAAAKTTAPSVGAARTDVAKDAVQEERPLPPVPSASTSKPFSNFSNPAPTPPAPPVGAPPNAGRSKAPDDVSPPEPKAEPGKGAPSAGSLGDDLASLIGAVRASANFGAAQPASSTPPPMAKPSAAVPPLSPHQAGQAAAAGLTASPPRPSSMAEARPRSDVMPEAKQSAVVPPLSPAAPEMRSRGGEATSGGGLPPISPAAPIKPSEGAPAKPATGSSTPGSAKDGNASTLAAFKAELSASDSEKSTPGVATVKPLNTQRHETATSYVPPPRPVVTPSAPIQSAVSTADKQAAVRSMEDTVSEMLRPLLRDWLDEHMPRIVEKALKSELVEREQRKSGPKPT